MKRAPRAKVAPRAVPRVSAVPRTSAARAAVADAARVAADAPVSQTKITVSRRGSRANRAGSLPFPWMGWTAGTRALAALCCEERLMTTTFQKRQKEMKRIEKRKMKEERRAQRKHDKPPASEVTYDPASDPTIDWNHSNEISSQEWLRLHSA